jgi:hypothetical protein
MPRQLERALRLQKLRASTVATRPAALRLLVLVRAEAARVDSAWQRVQAQACWGFSF